MSFLYRKTDFYRTLTEESQVGFPPGVPENMLRWVSEMSSLNQRSTGMFPAGLPEGVIMFENPRERQDVVGTTEFIRYVSGVIVEIQTFHWEGLLGTFLPISALVSIIIVAILEICWNTENSRFSDAISQNIIKKQNSKSEKLNAQKILHKKQSRKRKQKNQKLKRKLLQ